MYRTCSLLVACLWTLLAPASARSQSCSDNVLQIGNARDEHVTGRNASRTGSDLYGAGTVRYVNRGDTASVDLEYSGWTSGIVDVFDDITLLGAAPGASVPVTFDLHVVGTTYGYPQGTFYAEIFLRWIVDGEEVASRDFGPTQCDQFETCHGSFDETFSVVVPFTTGVSRTIECRVWSSSANSPHIGEQHVLSTRSFQGLPPGAFLVSCASDTLTPVLDAAPGAPSALALEAAWPNPARDEVHVRCSLPRGGTAFLRLYDSQGRVVATRTVEPAAGTRLTLSLGGQLEPGAYFLQLRQGGLSAIRMVTIVR